MKIIVILYFVLLWVLIVTLSNWNKEYHYSNGEVLLPDYVHEDTLIVTDAELLNRLLPCTNGSDGEISVILSMGTEPR